MTEALFEARALELGYRRRRRPAEPAFRAGELRIEEGECLALLGPNGSGKTTLLKALNGLLAPLSGSLLFRGEDAQASTELRRRSVYLHQLPYILAGTVSYNVLYGARARGCPPEEARERAHKALCDVGLPDFGKRGHRALSGGEAQRVALARALAAGADILLLDEPTASADAASAALILEVLASRRDSGSTIVFSTHDPELAAILATRTLRISGGSLQRK